MTRELARRIAGLADEGLEADLDGLEVAELPARLARHVADVVRSTLTGTDVARSLDVLDQLVVLLRATQPTGSTDDGVDGPPQLLRAVQPRVEGPGRLRLVPPVLGVGQSDLLVNARGEPNLLHSLVSEIRSADRIDLVVAFIKRSGLRPLLDALAVAAERGVPIRVLTTTYLGGTDQRALDDLVALGAQVRVSYDLGTTRLHAKGWLFERRSGFHTAYIGSSNLSHTAMTQGQEWNVRLAAAQAPDLVAKFRATFAAYWDDAALGFEPYDPADSALEDKLRRALQQAGSGDRPDPDDVLSPFRIQPMPHQSIMLEDLSREREVYDHWRNLVVAATGTGKTAVAAFDYERFARQHIDAGRPSLLFVAHRREILQQSRRMFRHVLRSGDFGELLVGDDKPEQWRHVFASIQSLTSERLAAIRPDAFDMVVVDEFHHAAAPSYRALLDHVRPKILLGLTATPERADGQDVTAWFDGRVATELRLWDALEQNLLSPFHYYGVGHEALDFRVARWEGGRYVAEDLDAVLTGDHIIMDWVVEQVRDKVTDPHRMRALAFASTVHHARFVADRFNHAGIRAVSLDGTSPRPQREQALRDLDAGDVQVVVTVDLFNEGVDVPAVDTVLLMRPTESVTVFLQQLGRGLRRDVGKDVLTVLDFVGFQHQRFRFDLRFRALTGVTRQELVTSVQNGFPFLPSGTFITLDRVAQQAVLENVKAHVPATKKALVDDVRLHAGDRGDDRYRLADYLSDAIAEPADVYRRKVSWTWVCRQAGLRTEPTPTGLADDEERLLARARTLTHVDDLARLDTYERLVRGDAPAVLSAHDEVLATMLYFAIWPGGKALRPTDGVQQLRRFPAVVDELLQIWHVARERITHVSHPLSGAALSRSPLRVHARYSREEMLAGIGWARCGENARPPQGHAFGTREAPDLDADVFDITWRKTEKAYSPTTMYADHAISAQEVHWESPNNLTHDAPTTRRYVEHAARGRHILLFARESKQGDLGTRPMLFVGPADYISHEGSRPVAFRWRLQRPLPTDFYETARMVAG